MTFAQIGLLLFALFFVARPAWAAPSGEEVAVVFNSRMPGSEGVARHYAEVRRVPTNQVFGLDLSTSEEITRQDFDLWLAGPLAYEFDRRQLWRFGTVRRPVLSTNDVREVRMPVESKIRYLVLCYGVPLKIKADATVKEADAERWQPELRRNEAAVDSELACLPLPTELRRLTGFVRNLAYTTTNSAWLHPTNGLLMVTRLDGPSAEIARGLVDLAVTAETNGLWGRAYFDIRSIKEPGYVQGDEWIQGAYEISRLAGFESVLDTNAATFPGNFPLSQAAFYAGWYELNACGPFAAAKVEFMPGAFAYHLHSASAATLRTMSQHWVGPLLARGAACSMGSVYEPYLSGTPDLGVFAARWLLQGLTFGEAAYAASSTLSWQTTVVGDPLYRAFAMNPQLLHLKLERTESPLLAWSYLRAANLNTVRGLPPLQTIGFLQSLEMTRTNAVLTEKLADLYAAVGKPESTVHAYRQALKNGPTPMQQLRLRQKLDAQFAVQNREADALENGLAWLDEFPAQAPARERCEQWLAIANQLERREAAARLQRLVPPPPAAPTNAPARP